jgi:chorismate mutase
VTRKENAIYIVKSGGVVAVHAALAANPNSERIAKAVADIFNKIAAHEDCIPQLVQAGVIKTLIDLMNKFPTNPAIVQACISALGRIGITVGNMASTISHSIRLSLLFNNFL